MANKILPYKINLNSPSFFCLSFQYRTCSNFCCYYPYCKKGRENIPIIINNHFPLSFNQSNSIATINKISIEKSKVLKFTWKMHRQTKRPYTPSKFKISHFIFHSLFLKASAHSHDISLGLDFLIRTKKINQKSSKCFIEAFHQTHCKLPKCFIT